MGLDTTHNAWHGAYSSFNAFRHWLSERIGISLEEYDGYGGAKDLATITHDIKPLLNHSDCDGELSPEECKQVANGLQKIIESAEPDEDFWSHYQRAIQFRNGCLLAHSKNEKLLFQ